MEKLDIEQPNWKFNKTPYDHLTVSFSLEEYIISCLLQKPHYVAKKGLLASDFNQYPKLFAYLQNVFLKYGTIDFILINSNLSKPDQVLFWKFYSQFINIAFCTTANFDKYVEALKLYNIENTKAICERKKVDNITALYKPLLDGKIDSEEFKRKVDEIC